MPKLLCAVFSLLLCSACLMEPGDQTSSAAPTLQAAKLGKTAIVPFESLSGQPNAGLILSGLLAEELEKTPQLRLRPQDVVAALLAPKEGEVLAPDELGKLLKAQTLLLGTVSEYRYKRGVGEEPVIGLSLRLVDAESGRVLWRARRSRIGSYSWWREDSLSRLAGAVCRDLARELTGSLHDAP